MLFSKFCPYFLNLLTPQVLYNKNSDFQSAMLLPSEIEAKSLIPAVRAILAKKLIQEYSLKEEDVAKVLGITQAAVSNYVRGTRGDLDLISKLGSVREVMRMVDDIARDLAADKAYTPNTMAKFFELCNYMRYTLLICDIHHSMESNIDEQICEQCRGTLTRKH